MFHWNRRVIYNLEHFKKKTSYKNLEEREYKSQPNL